MRNRFSFRGALGALLCVLALSGPLLSPPAFAQDISDHGENSIVDRVFRGQATPAFPATLYWGLSTTACSDSSVGTEVSGGSYARVAITASLANFSGTQGAGTTTASSGTGGVTSNNVAISFTTPTAGWGTVGWYHITDAPTGGNIWLCDALTIAKTVNTGDSVSFPAGAAQITVQ